MISLWFHIPVVLGLLASHAWTVWYSVRRVRALQAALVAKKVLLGPTGILADQKALLAGEMLQYRDDKGNTLEITTSAPTTLDVKVYAR